MNKITALLLCGILIFTSCLAVSNDSLLNESAAVSSKVIIQNDETDAPEADLEELQKAKEELAAIIYPLTELAAQNSEVQIKDAKPLPFGLDDSYLARLLTEAIENKSEQIIEQEVDDNPFSHIMPDESGKVIIIMFHNFITEYKDGDRKITTTLTDFRQLLERLYSEGFRTVPLTDFITGSISLKHGEKPIIFTFDDGRPSQFSFLKNEDGTLSENPDTAIKVMEQFYSEYPDFGLNGTFFVNLGYSGTFGTNGTLSERVSAVIDKGFEVKNHSYSHANLGKMTKPEQIELEIGKNAKTLAEIRPGQKMDVLALPYGISNNKLKEHIVKGTYDEYSYENIGIMLVGAEPAVLPYIKGADQTRIRRVLASGLDPVELDAGWWLNNLDETPMYISDGDPNTITVPASKKELIDIENAESMGKTVIFIDDTEMTNTAESTAEEVENA